MQHEGHSFEVTDFVEKNHTDSAIGFDAELPKSTGNSKPCIFLELCAGSAKLSAAVRSTGIPVVPIDHKHNRHATRCKVVELDLSQPHAWTQLLIFVGQLHCVGLSHCSPLRDLQQGARNPNGRRHSRATTTAFRRRAIGYNWSHIQRPNAHRWSQLPLRRPGTICGGLAFPWSSLVHRKSNKFFDVELALFPFCCGAW